jgi:hypothetical protein
VAPVGDPSPGRVGTCRPAPPLVLRAHPVAGPDPDRLAEAGARGVPPATGRGRERAAVRLVGDRRVEGLAPAPVELLARAPARASRRDLDTAGHPPRDRARRDRPSAIVRHPVTRAPAPVHRRAPAPVHRRAPARAVVHRPVAVLPTPSTTAMIVPTGPRSPAKVGAVSPGVVPPSSGMASTTVRMRTPPRVADSRRSGPMSS